MQNYFSREHFQAQMQAASVWPIAKNYLLRHNKNVKLISFRIKYFQ